MALDTIWKFPLAITGRQKISMPATYSILSAGVDPMGELCIWAAVDRKAPRRNVEVVIFRTGDPLPHIGSFIGTVKMTPFVWHVFTGPGDSANALTEYHYATKREG